MAQKSLVLVRGVVIRLEVDFHPLMGGDEDLWGVVPAHSPYEFFVIAGGYRKDVYVVV